MVKTARPPFETGSIEFVYSICLDARCAIRRANFHTFKYSRQDAHFNVELRLHSKRLAERRRGRTSFTRRKRGGGMLRGDLSEFSRNSCTFRFENSNEFRFPPLITMFCENENETQVEGRDSNPVSTTYTRITNSLIRA